MILSSIESVKKLEAVTQENSQLLSSRLKESNSYQLIPDRDGNLRVLLEAIANSQNRLIIVSPWLRKGAFDSILAEVEKALYRGVEIRIGFGYYRDLDKAIALDNLENWSYFPDRDSDNSYNAIPLWLKLQQKYGKQAIYLKWLGTHEKFLVSDRKIALISSYNFLSGSFSGKSRELGIKTDNPEIIAALLLRSELDFN